eukprot:TRINITY_DN83193_c0_g1_i1.p1 TRINITY_DN83193_c0_g1~~TRINITY_DN83193_c0_g1_i1.p1  ORF type:complete len:304 (-),score=63.88 TRINITY_DN83193_c0_g1_i1:102-1013(-)
MRRTEEDMSLFRPPRRRGVLARRPWQGVQTRAPLRAMSLALGIVAVLLVGYDHARSMGSSMTDSRSSNEASFAAFVMGPARGGGGAVRGRSCGHRGQPGQPAHVRNLFGGPGAGMAGRGAPGAYGGGGGMGGAGGEPPWLGTAFLALVVLSFIPGPWQIITSPILSLINMFYMFKFGIFILGIAAVFGLQWWIDQTTCEGQCPACGLAQRGAKQEPFNCMMCGEVLEYKDERFQRYVKSGKVPGSAFEQAGDFMRQAAEEAAKKAAEQSPPPPKPPSASSTSGSSQGKKGPPKSTNVVDAEVL